MDNTPELDVEYYVDKLIDDPHLFFNHRLMSVYAHHIGLIKNKEKEFGLREYYTDLILLIESLIDKMQGETLRRLRELQEEELESDIRTMLMADILSELESIEENE